MSDEEKTPMTVNEKERVMMEQISMFADPKYSRRAAQVTTLSSLYAPMSDKPKPLYATVRTRDGVYEEEIRDSILASQAWDELVKRLGRNPSKWELINETRALAAVYDTGSATFIRDTAGFKPIDETKNEQNIKVSPLRDYTEEELEQIIAEESKKRHEKEAVEDAKRVPDTNLLDISDDPNSSNSD